VLARLDEIDGVAESRVDWTGRRFLLHLERGADEERVAGAGAETLGQGTRRLDGGETSEALDAFEKGEAWMRAGETLRLSRHEAEVLGLRYGTEAGEELGLDEERTRQLVEVFARELGLAFERAHTAAGGGPLRIVIHGKAIVEACGGFLDAEQRAALEKYLEGIVGPPGP
jgi:hypothetical protein